MQKTKIIAEIGINHNGDLKIAKDMIDVAAVAGCDYVKFQKRNPDICVPENQKSKMKDTPWGRLKYIDYKKKIEFCKDDYRHLFSHSENMGIKCFASVWDKDSIDFMKGFCKIAKIPSALITDLDLCMYARDNFETLIISTGMSSEEEIETCVRKSNPDVIMHTNSTYPSPVDELNLNYINWLKQKYPKKEIGYSGHEYGLVTTFASVSLGCSWIERHITLDRAMWGSDQLASVEPIGLMKLARGIRDVEKAMGEMKPRKLYESEKIKKESLRK